MLKAVAPRALTDWSAYNVQGFNAEHIVDDLNQRPMLINATDTITKAYVLANQCACAISGNNEVGHGDVGDPLYGKVMSLIYNTSDTIVGAMVQRQGVVELVTVADSPLAIGDYVMCGDTGMVDIATGVGAAEVIDAGWVDISGAGVAALPKGRVIALNATDDRVLVDLDC